MMHGRELAGRDDPRSEAVGGRKGTKFFRLPNKPYGEDIQCPV